MTNVSPAVAEMRRKVKESVEYIRSKTNMTPRAGVILGSGLGPLAENLSGATVIPYAEIPHFPKCTALGHAGNLVFGEIGGKPLEAMALIGLGYRSLSMSAASIGPVKAMVLALETDRLAAFLDEQLASSGGSESLRPALVAYAERHGIAA